MHVVKRLGLLVVGVEHSAEGLEVFPFFAGSRQEADGPTTRGQMDHTASPIVLGLYGELAYKVFRKGLGVVYGQRNRKHLYGTWQGLVDSFGVQVEPKVLAKDTFRPLALGG